MADERLRKSIGALRSTDALGHEARQAALEAIAAAIDSHRALIHGENGKDLERAGKDGISPSLLHRLEFTDEKVATVDEKGVVTAVGEGSSTITVTDKATGLSASCIVRVRIEDQKPDNGGSSSSGSSSSGGSSSNGSQSSNVDLTAFANQVMADYEFSHLQLADASLMDDLYSGLSGVSTEQCLVYCTMMTMNNGEFVLVQVKDSKDVDTVKGILQVRINYMAGDGENPGGAWYPGPTEQWKNNSRVTSNGNYVMMVVHENCDDIVTAFNDLF